MPELPEVSPDYFQILVVRELRKAGFEVGDVRIHRRSELAEPEQGFVLELLAPLSRTGSTWRALLVCRRQSSPVTSDVIESVIARLPQVPAEVALVFATADFAGDALAAAQRSRIALLRVVEARRAFDLSGWGTPGQYPSWLPAYLTELLDCDTPSQTPSRARLVEADRADMILKCLVPY